MRARTRLTFVALGLAFSMVPASAHASPQDLFGFGARTSAMAMTGASYAEGSEAVFANPAGLASVRLRSLEIGVLGGNYQVSIDDENHALAPPRGMTIGFALPLPFEDVLEDRLVFGGAFYTPAEVILRGTVRFPTVVQFPVLDRAQVLAIQVGLGLDLHGIVDGLTLGVGVSALANVLGELDVELDETNAFSSVVETQLLTSFAPIVGVRYARPEFGFGLTYRHELAARMDLNIRTRDLPVMLPVLTVGGVVQYDPPVLIAEGYWRPLPSLMLVLNLTTRFWSAFGGNQVPTTSMGLNAPDPGFSIMPSPRVAAEGTLHSDRNFTFTLRGGYAFEGSPAPPARMAPRRTASGMPTGDPIAFRYLDNHRHVLSAGLGWVIHLGQRTGRGERLTLDAYAQVHALQPREHEVGRTDGAPPMQTEGYIIMGGWTAGAHF